MNKQIFSVLALALTAACSRGNRSGPAPAMVGPLPPTEPPPVLSLIGYRTELGLNSTQVTVIDSIGDQLGRDNAPLTAQLRERRGTPRNSRDALDEYMRPSSEARTLAEQIRSNNRRAEDGLRDVLTADQRTRVCELMRRTARERRQLDADREPRRVETRRLRRARELGDSLRAMERGPFRFCAQVVTPSTAPRE